MPTWSSSHGDCSIVGVIPAGIKFQISLPTADLPALIPVSATHLPSEVAAIAQPLPNDRIALQWDVVRMLASTSVASDDLVETWKS